MRVATTISVVLMSGVLFAGSVNAGECELTCEGECRQAAAMCKLGAALEARADKMACLDQVNGGMLECHGIDLEARHACSELCVSDLRGCVREARTAFKACKAEVRSAYGECRSEAQGWAQDMRAECGEAKAGCMDECQGPNIPDGGGLG